jgi:hypothetical protein
MRDAYPTLIPIAHKGLWSLLYMGMLQDMQSADYQHRPLCCSRGQCTPTVSFFLSFFLSIAQCRCLPGSPSPLLLTVGCWQSGLLTLILIVGAKTHSQT